jgi:hypothetical protein
MALQRTLPLFAIPLAVLAFEGVAHADYGVGGAACGFVNLADAIAAAGVGGTVYVESGVNVVNASAAIVDDVTLVAGDASCSPDASATATLQFNGFMDRILDISNGAFVTLERLTLTDGHVADTGGLVRLQGFSTLWAVDSVFERGEADVNGGCISAIQSEVWLLGSEMKLCTAREDGGNAWLDLAYMYVGPDSTIRDGTAISGDGGNVAVDGSTLSMHGDMFGGFAGANGGGIAGRDPNSIESVITVWGEVHGNLADFGGGVYIEGIDSVLTVRGTITDNDAEAGGGILAELSGLARVDENGSVSANRADRGGGIRVMGPGSVDLVSGATIADNVAYKVGGGINAVNADITADEGVLFDENVAESQDNLTQGGGAIRLSNSTFTGVGVAFELNGAAEGRGGAILAVDGSEVDLTNASIGWSNAGEGGGIFAHDSSIVLRADTDLCDPSALGANRFCSEVFFNAAFVQNGSTGRGGGISLHGSSVLDAKQTMIGYNISDVDGKQLAIDSGQAVATIVNGALVSDPSFIIFGAGSGVDVLAGTLDLRSSTIAGHDTGLQFAAGTTGVMHRNIVAENTLGAVLGGSVTGNCNLSQTLAESPTGTNNEEGDPGFVPGARSAYEITSASTLAWNQCSSGPATDIDGNARPVGAWDRGMYEVQ